MDGLSRSYLVFKKCKKFVLELWFSPEQNGDIFYVDGFDPFLGLNIFCNLRKSLFGSQQLVRVGEPTML